MLTLPEALEPLRAYAQFLLYKTSPDPVNPCKTKKFVVEPVKGWKCDPTDPNAWMTFDEAVIQLPRWGAQGIGFCFTEADPFVFTDLDNCLHDGKWSDFATSVMQWFPGAAIEVSQSGTGAHVIASYTGTVPPHRTRRADMPGLEVYHTGRFVALTGNMCAGGSAAADCTANLPTFLASYLPPIEVQHDTDWTDAPRPEWGGPDDDDELIERMLRSKPISAGLDPTAVTLADLWECNVAKLAAKYPPDGTDEFNRSHADAALFQHLAFWTGGDCERMLRLAQMSGLAREKWERESYLRGSILKAARQQRDVLKAPSAAPAAKPLPEPEQVAAAAAQQQTRDISKAEFVDGEPFMPPDRQLELFDGCAYVLDRHQIFTRFGMLDQQRFNAQFGGWNFSMDGQNRKISTAPWECFTQSKILRFPRVTTTCFRPELPSGAIVHDGAGGAVVTRINTYRPLQTRREAGDPTPWLNLLQAQLPDERDRRILISYMASCIQNKGRKFQWWPVLQAAEGNGKTLLLTAMRHAIGEPFCFAPSVTTIAKTGNQFNSWIEGRMFIAVEEIYVAERRNFLEDFKTTVTNEWLPVEGKGLNQIMLDNRANGIMATNHRDGVPITADSRRYCVFYMAQQNKDDIQAAGLTGDFFRQFWDYAKGRGQWEAQGDNYGFAVWHDYLASYPIDAEFDPAGACQVAPKTSSTHAAIKESLGQVEQQVMEIIAQGRQGFLNGWVSSIMLDRLLEEMGRGGRVAHHKRRAMMQSLGYDWHPALSDGRVNNPVAPDGAKPRLYVHMSNLDALALTSPAEVAAAYTASQTGLTA